MVSYQTTGGPTLVINQLTTNHFRKCSIKRETRASNRKVKSESDDELDLFTRRILYDKKQSDPKKCHQCQQTFPTIKSLQKHRKLECLDLKPLIKKTRIPYKDVVHKCNTCDLIFDTLKLLRNHKRSTHKRTDVVDMEEEPTYKLDEIQDLYICSVCSAEFQLQSEVVEHVKSHKVVITCDQCQKNFPNYFDLGMHRVSHSKDKHIRCPLCSYVSTNLNPYSFKAHINYVHLKKFPFYCKECGKGFKHQKTYNEHLNSHKGMKPYICVVCSKGFTYQKYLNVHQVRNHQVGTTGNKIQNECRSCNRYFYKPEDLDKHMESCYKRIKKPKSLTPAKAFLCDSCGQTFTEKAKLVEHLRVHKGDLPYVCTWCGKKFPVKSYLKTHERVHTGEKPYSCEFCGKRFAQHAPFRVHRRTHTGERPYVCDFCSKGFTTNQGLKLHKKNCQDNQFGKMLIVDECKPEYIIETEAGFDVFT